MARRRGLPIPRLPVQNVLIRKVKTGYETQEEAAKYAKKLTDEEADKDNGDQKPKDVKK